MIDNFVPRVEYRRGKRLGDHLRSVSCRTYAKDDQIVIRVFLLSTMDRYKTSSHPPYLSSVYNRYIDHLYPGDIGRDMHTTLGYRRRNDDQGITFIKYTRILHCPYTAGYVIQVAKRTLSSSRDERDDMPCVIQPERHLCLPSLDHSTNLASGDIYPAQEIWIPNIVRRSTSEDGKRIVHTPDSSKHVRATPKCRREAMLKTQTCQPTCTTTLREK